MKKFKDIADQHCRTLEASIDPLEENFSPAVGICIEALRNGRKLLVCGNGGSAADAQHFAAEMVGRYQKNRTAMPVLALTTDASVMTAISNDFGFEQCFVRQIEAFGKKGDVLIAISTSGDSPNVTEAARAAGKSGMKVVALTGAGGGQLQSLADVLLAVSSTHTARIQEIHAICLHAMAEVIETELSLNEGK